MRSVTVQRSELLARVRANREAHRQVFECALEGYRKRMVLELERRLHDLRRGRRVDHYIRLPIPEDHTDDYDRVLAMAEMSVHDLVELEADDFSMYVLDQWEWRRSFVDSTARYLR